MAKALIVVVTGSTGRQGGAVARGLLERGHKVRAVTRDPNSNQAKSLANAGAMLVAASLEDTSAITKALEGATSLFAMTAPSGGTTPRDDKVLLPPMQPRQQGSISSSRPSAPPTDRPAFRTLIASTRSKSTSPKSASGQRFSLPLPSWRTSIS
jgi:NmrA-like family